ncbi:MAG: hypothetical protein Q9162_003747 [Coniocarpon cinnabarinum]
MLFRLAALAAATHYASAADTPRPKGVGPDYAKFYKDPHSFSCIFNPSITVPTSQVNDNYCDCPDGSDEPGTAACAYLSYNAQAPAPPTAPNLNTTHALPGFYCKNRNHNPSYLPFTAVGDGICDHERCCDGSDEAPGVCADKCKEIGAEWRKMDEKRQLSLSAAARKRTELVSEAAKKRKEIEDYIRDLDQQISTKEHVVSDLEKRKDQLEKEEKSRVIRKQPAAGKAAVLAGLSKEKLGQWKTSLEYYRRRRDEETARAAELEQVLSQLKEEHNPDSADGSVQRAVQSYDAYVTKSKPANNDASERDASDLVGAEDHGIPWSDFETEDTPGELETLYAFEQYLPSFLQEYIDSQLRSLRTFLIQNGVLPDKPSGSQPEESQPLKDARKTLQDSQNDLENTRKSKKEHEDSLTADFGPDDVFRTKEDQCISGDSGEYTYEICWMGQVTQKPKKGGMSHNIGRFTHFTTVSVDEEVRDDGKGIGQGERLAARHEGGGTCWQGPARSSTVIMACSEEDEVWKVMEEEKCVYRLEVGTPAVCETSGQRNGESKVHQEL